MCKNARNHYKYSGFSELDVLKKRQNASNYYTYNALANFDRFLIDLVTQKIDRKKSTRFLQKRPKFIFYDTFWPWTPPNMIFGPK